MAGFKHILVDEYQDVNAASARLLRAICGAGTDVWVVADQRQSIYRFRGAEPSNVAKFADGVRRHPPRARQQLPILRSGRPRFREVFRRHGRRRHGGTRGRRIAPMAARYR